MQILRYIIPILVGALIGYCTNYIAIKMLFRPRKAIKIGNYTLPFTPGIIPKNQGRIARAVGEAVGKQLFTGEDLKNIFLSEEMENTVVDTAMEKITTKNTIKELLEDGLGIERSQEAVENVAVIMSNKIEEVIQKAKVSELIAEEGKKVLLEKIQGTMLAMFVNEERVQPMAEALKIGIDQYLQEHGQEKIRPLVTQEIAELQNNTPEQLLASVEVTTKMIEDGIKVIYEKVVSEELDQFLTKVDISRVVEDKMNEMKIEEIEELVMSIMKHELQAVINLGALIGAVIGIINIL